MTIQTLNKIIFEEPKCLDFLKRRDGGEWDGGKKGEPDTEREEREGIEIGK